MIIFFKSGKNRLYAAQITQKPDKEIISRLSWLFDAVYLDQTGIKGVFLGPRKEMITPWSTNAVEITQNMGMRFSR
jgi:phosphoribosylformylglycinamidine synthase